MQTIHSLFEAQAELHPRRIAALHQGERISYAALNERANRLAHYLKKISNTQHQAIALSLNRSIELLITLLAILKAGFAYVPLDSSHPEERLLFTLKDNNNPLLILSEISLQKKFKHYRGPLLILAEEKKAIEKESASNLTETLDAHQLAYIIYTSGSTGKPKGVLIEHHNLVNYCHWFSDYCQCQPEQRIDFSSHYIFDMAVTTSIVPLALGLTVVICDDFIKKDPSLYLQHLRKYRINITKMTPSYFKLLLHEATLHSIPLPDLSNITLGGENLFTKDCQDWLQRYPEHTIYNEYGPTEATVAITQFQVTTTKIPTLGTHVPIGKPGPNMDCFLLNDELQSLAEEEIGELYIGGACLARGYLNQPELTQKAFIQSPFGKGRLYRTGDLCLKLSSGDLVFVERRDYQVKIRGFRIDPSEIEQCLQKHPFIKQAVVLARQDKQKEANLIAYYIEKNNKKSLTTKQLRDLLKQNLPEYMVPAIFVKMETFPLTDNGKLDRKALPIPLFAANQNYLAPRNPLEKKLTEIWSKELNISPIGIKDDFFELGGHSLAAARIISEINNTLSKNLKVKDLYLAPTISRLAKEVQRAEIIQEHRKTALRLGDSFPLSDFQLLLWLSNLFAKKARRLNVVKRKRLQGILNHKALHFALQALLRKHPMLRSDMSKYKPLQHISSLTSLILVNKNLKNCSPEEQETLIAHSFAELANYFPWPRHQPLIKVRLFQLEKELFEIQLSLPHTIADDISLEIVLNDLSLFYEMYPSSLASIIPDMQFEQYVLNEQYHLEHYLEEQIIFWKNYLQNSSLTCFPPQKIVKKTKQFNYSSHLEIPEQYLIDLQYYCSLNHVSLSNVLCAALAITLQKNCLKQKNDFFVMNRVRSTRENAIYDHTIGCFLRIETLKISTNPPSNLASLAQQIQQMEMDTSTYQSCPSLVKLANIGYFQQKNNILKRGLGKIFQGIATILGISALNKRIMAYSSTLMSMSLNNHYLVNINIEHHFIHQNKQSKQQGLFGLIPRNTITQPIDFLKIDNVLDVCFQYRGTENKSYLIISANLEPSFRQLLGQEILKLINCTTKEVSQTQIEQMNG